MMAPPTKPLPLFQIMDIVLHEKDEKRQKQWHEQPAQIITLQKRYDSLESFQVLHIPQRSYGAEQWFSWPVLLEYGDDLKNRFRYALTYRERLQLYRPSLVMTVKKASDPTRCIFCHEDMEGMTANCLSCGGAMHYACAEESGGECVTPGCKSSTITTTKSKIKA